MLKDYALFMALVSVIGLAACGVKPKEVDAPPGSKPGFPHVYPHQDSPAVRSTIVPRNDDENTFSKDVAPAVIGQPDD